MSQFLPLLPNLGPLYLQWHVPAAAEYQPTVALQGPVRVQCAAPSPARELAAEAEEQCNPPSSGSSENNSGPTKIQSETLWSHLAGLKFQCFSEFIPHGGMGTGQRLSAVPRTACWDRWAPTSQPRSPLPSGTGHGVGAEICDDGGLVVSSRCYLREETAQLFLNPELGVSSLLTYLPSSEALCARGRGAGDRSMTFTPRSLDLFLFGYSSGTKRSVRLSLL